jgi:hypothetical protein
MQKNMISFVLILVLFGCSKNIPQQKENTIDPLNRILPSKVSITPGKPINPQIEDTTNLIITESKFIQSNTPSVSGTHSLNSLAQKMSEEKISNMIRMIYENEKCRLPCWLNIYPGLSSWDQEKPRLSSLFGEIKSNNQLSIDNNEIYSTPRLDLLNNNKVRFAMDRISFEIQDDKISRIFLTFNSASIIDGIGNDFAHFHQDLSIEKLLTQNGPPDKIWIDTESNNSENSNVGYTIILDYEKKGFLIVYYGFGTLSNQRIAICPKYSDEINRISDSFQIILKNPDDPIDLKQRIYFYDPGYHYRNVKLATEMDEQAFYNYVIDKDNDCFFIIQ